jgi:hypothetical protein
MNTLLQEYNRTIPQGRSQAFFDLFAFERKRSERPEKLFLLMKLTVFGSSELRSVRDIIRGAVETLLVFSQETHVKGWYRHASTFGVIFTEMAGIDTQTLRENIYGRLSTHLTEAQVDAIHISFHTYPEDGSSVKPDNLKDFMFHPLSLKNNELKISLSR